MLINILISYPYFERNKGFSMVRKKNRTHKWYEKACEEIKQKGKKGESKNVGKVSLFL